MAAMLDRLSYGVIVPLAVLMLLAPFRPVPHALEKLSMLIAGNLYRPIDTSIWFFI